MLDISKVGSYISKLRKKKDWTQMELADRLNVSHQAVSKWERGDSLPDIGTLMTIGRIFGISLDELMNGGQGEDRSQYVKNIGRVMEGIAENRPKEVSSMINSGEADIEGLIEVSPLLKASELSEVATKIDKQLFNPELLLRLAPFVETDLLDEMIVDGTAEDSVDIKFIQKIAPFLSKDSLSKLIGRANKDGMDLNDVTRLAAFLGKETVDELVDQAMSEEIDRKVIVRLAPFCSREKLMELVDQTDGQLDSAFLISLAPFLGRKYLKKLIDERDIDNIDPETITHLAPFIDKTTLSNWLRKLMNKET